MFPNGLPADDCVYSNQNLSYTAQLEFGIRWFDIDLCWVTDEEATPAVSAGLWTCHNDAYAVKVDEILHQVRDLMNMSPGDGNIVSFYFNENYNRSRSEPMAEALSDLLESHFPTIEKRLSRRKRGTRGLTMNTDFDTTGEWPQLLRASRLNQRVFFFVHESPQLGDQPWAHDPIPSQSPREVVKDSCDGSLTSLVKPAMCALICGGLTPLEAMVTVSLRRQIFAIQSHRASHRQSDTMYSRTHL